MRATLFLYQSPGSGRWAFAESMAGVDAKLGSVASIDAGDSPIGLTYEVLDTSVTDVGGPLHAHGVSASGLTVEHVGSNVLNTQDAFFTPPESTLQFDDIIEHPHTPHHGQSEFTLSHTLAEGSKVAETLTASDCSAESSEVAKAVLGYIRFAASEAAVVAAWLWSTLGAAADFMLIVVLSRAQALDISASSLKTLLFSSEDDQAIAKRVVSNCNHSEHFDIRVSFLDLSVPQEGRAIAQVLALLAVSAVLYSRRWPMVGGSTKPQAEAKAEPEPEFEPNAEPNIEPKKRGSNFGSGTGPSAKPPPRESARLGVHDADQPRGGGETVANSKARFATKVPSTPSSLPKDRVAAATLMLTDVEVHFTTCFQTNVAQAVVKIPPPKNPTHFS